MSNIKILPIFNQAAPGIWHDMIRMRVAAMQHNYNIKLTDKEIANAMSEFQKSWKRLSFNFAFGAYDGDQMIGCVSGDVQKRTSFIRHLYVLPEYQGQHIGAKLLDAAECATSVAAYQADIVALPRAESFYRHLGYTSPMKTNNYFKGLKPPKCRTVPLFHCAPAFDRACSALRIGASDAPNAKQINAAHMPVFAEYGIDSKIRAVGILDGGHQIIKSESDFWCGPMSRALERYITAKMR